MSSKPSLPDLYRAHGFVITAHLQALIDTYGESEVISPIEPQGEIFTKPDGTVATLKKQRRTIRFCNRRAIDSDPHSEYYEEINAFMGSPVAPVGFALCYELLLTEDGQLVGHYESTIVTWGTPGDDWRATVAAYLANDEERVLGDPR